MRRFFSKEGQAALDRLLQGKALLAFDFDGTLAPLVERPAEARMRPYTAALLRAIARRCPVAVVSGRSRSDVASRLAGAPVREVVGNHGAEAPGRRPAVVVGRWRRALEAAVQDVPGAWVEDKGYTLSVHYRGARDRQAAEAAILEEAARLPDARVHRGHLAINVSPVAAPDRGAAVRALARRLKCGAVLFVGDEAESGLRVVIGPGKDSGAAYLLGHQREVDRLLVMVLDRLLQRAPSPRRP